MNSLFAIISKEVNLYSAHMSARGSLNLRHKGSGGPLRWPKSLVIESFQFLTKTAYEYTHVHVHRKVFQMVRAAHAELQVA